MDHALKVLQANVNHCAGAQDLLVQSLAQWHINVAVISEPYRISDRSDWVGDSTNSVAIVTNTCDTPVTSSISKNGCVGIRIGAICIVGVYFSPNRTLAEFEEFLNEVDVVIRWSRPFGLIVAGDFNAKSRAWGSSVTDPRGVALLEWAAAHDLSPLNRGSEFTCVRMGGGSVIDITFAESSVAPRVQGWEVLTEVETLSDHRYIRFQVLPSADARSGQSPVHRTPPEIGPKWALKSLVQEELEIAAIETILRFLSRLYCF